MWVDAWIKAAWSTECFFLHASFSVEKYRLTNLLATFCTFYNHCGHHTTFDSQLVFLEAQLSPLNTQLSGLYWYFLSFHQTDTGIEGAGQKICLLACSVDRTLLVNSLHLIIIYSSTGTSWCVVLHSNFNAVTKLQTANAKDRLGKLRKIKNQFLAGAH